MSEERGVIWSVYTETTGDSLIAPALVGAAYLQVDDSYEFEEGGGRLQIGTTNQILNYSRHDPDLDVIYLEAPLSAALEEGTPIWVYPISQERRAEVRVDDTDEALQARVPYNTYAQLPLGTRNFGERREVVGLKLDEGDWVIDDIIGEEVVFDGGVIDPDSTIPPAALTDGLPPEVAPTIVVEQFAIGSLRIRWDAIVNADPVRYEVYGSAATPVAIDADHLIDRIDSTSLVVSRLRSGASIPADAPTYFRVRAVEAQDGPGPLSSEASGTPRRISADDLGRGAITPISMSTDALVPNQVSNGSFEQVDSAGFPLDWETIRSDWASFFRTDTDDPSVGTRSFKMTTTAGAWINAELAQSAGRAIPVEAGLGKSLLLGVNVKASASVSKGFTVHGYWLDANRVPLTGTHTVSNKDLTGNVATLTLTAPHRLLPGDQIVVQGVDGTFDGVYFVSSTPSIFSLTYEKTAANVASTASAGSVIYARRSAIGTDLEVTFKALTGNVATIATATPHKMKVGDLITVSQVDSTFDGTYSVVSVPNSTTLIYGRSAADVSASVASGRVNKALSAANSGITTSWTRREQQVEVPSDARYIRMAVRFHNIGTSATVWVDAITCDRVFTSGFLAANSVTANEIAADYAYLGDVQASQIRTGTMSADVTISGSFKTASSGQRMEFNNNGLQSFNSAGAVTSSLTAASGGLVLSGSMTAGDDASLVRITTSVGRGSIDFDGNDYSAPGWIRSSIDAEFGGANLTLRTTRSNGGATTEFRLDDRVGGGFRPGLSTNAVGIRTAGSNFMIQDGVTSFPGVSRPAFGLSSENFIVDGVTDIWLEAVRYVQSSTIHNYQAGTTNSRQVWVNSTTGRLHTPTSSERFKQDVSDHLVPLDSILLLNPVKFRNKADMAEWEGEHPEWDEPGYELGLIAERLDEDEHMRLFVQRDSDGQPDGIHYDRLVVALIPAIRELHDRVNTLEGALKS